MRGDKTEDGGGVSQRKDLKDDFDELEYILIESLVQVASRWVRTKAVKCAMSTFV